jgi:UDP-2,4-diacetamido-2,4,6-trideoxy-beta-L-altropyranose hydrolase
LSDYKLQLRQITIDDMELLFKWQIHPTTRQFFTNTALPSLEEHSAWLAKSIDQDNRLLFMGVNSGHPVGVVRIDIEALKAEVSLYVSPDEYGKGYGTELVGLGVKWIKENFSNIALAYAKVSAQNTASKKVFLKNNFELHSGTYKLDL